MIEFWNMLDGNHDVRIVLIDRMKAAFTPDTPPRAIHGPPRRGHTSSSRAFTLPSPLADFLPWFAIRETLGTPHLLPAAGEIEGALAAAEAWLEMSDAKSL